MGAQHTATLGKKLQLAAKGRLCVIASYVNEKYEGENPSRRYGLLDRKNGSTLASMTIQTLPGCCGVLVLHSFQGEPENVVKFIAIAKVAAKDVGYGQIVFTLRMESPILDLIPLATDDRTASFLNGKTQHLVTIRTINLDQEPNQISPTAGE